MITAEITHILLLLSGNVEEFVGKASEILGGRMEAGLNAVMTGPGQIGYRPTSSTRVFKRETEDLTLAYSCVTSHIARVEAPCA